MEFVYHIVAIRVNEHPGHTYGGFVSAISERGMTEPKAYSPNLMT
jgi:hypothetical protein